MKLFPFSRYQISGHSMEPSYEEGEVIWINHWAFLFSKPKVGDVIILHYQDKELIKRIISVGKRSVEVLGDNKNDSLGVGSIPIDSVIGKVITKQSRGF